MAICPKCNKQIDDDSYFCEHCGTKLYACPKCHIIGKGEGKRCGHCGSLLVEASSIGNDTTPAPSTIPNVSPSQPANTNGNFNGNVNGNQRPLTPSNLGGGVNYGNAVQKTCNANAPAPADNIEDLGYIPGSLYCAAMNTRIQLIDGALIGRTQGQYASQLGTFNYISGRHAVLQMTPNGWTITDVGSTNGTKVNGIRTTPNVPMPFRMGDIVRIANTYDFKAE